MTDDSRVTQWTDEQHRLHTPAASKNQRTIFQTSVAYHPTVDIRGDVAVIYGINDSVKSRVESWRTQAYQVHLMTGVAWGDYHRYLNGDWDGKKHLDEAQTDIGGNPILHGVDVPYMCPGPDYGRFLAEGVLEACAAGVSAVHLEEPEFWARGGYSPAFQREWELHYDESWEAPHSSVDARWRANKLMYFLYRRALQQVFDAVQAWNANHAANVKCYVPTHSLINYAAWRIVSPESSLALLKGSDGFVAQVWTGTAREPNYYRGLLKERTFETAFLEYGIMQNLVRSTSRTIWYLADPVEDKPTYSWSDYRANYQSTLVASLLAPEVANYEITPWPERVFGYPGKEGQTGGAHIPDDYAQELQQVFNALKDMKQCTMDCIGADFPALGVAMSDSLMFQRGGPHESDDKMGHIFGLSMPFVKQGIPIQPMQLENFSLDGYLDKVSVLLMSYEGQKPLSPEVHLSLRAWVESGGILIFVDDDRDPFNLIREWWNIGSNRFTTPRHHLFGLLGADCGEHGFRGHPVGKGTLTYLRYSPSDLANTHNGSARLIEEVVKSLPDITWQPAGYLGLRRGPYIAIAGLDETEAPGITLEGSFVDLFDAKLLVKRRVQIFPGARHLLIDLSRMTSDVVACAGQLSDEKCDSLSWTGCVRGAEGTPGVLMLRLPWIAYSATVDDEKVQIQVDPEMGLVWLRFDNIARPQSIRVHSCGHTCGSDEEAERLGYVTVFREDAEP
ncbi:hypothetical protein BD324DRAFT_653579 [Kockovaella imperatae]|uniref:Uncharacterized protein n=1 Tax=Kockovaella imperatae TaxID=4999 RepID=A0A1Y1U8H7_9TREE|nr:hypothetical protein BD324DRAFT_653579 [Kockovaella imperatae]ORX34318.1 hypothetical protein BD324DRAFT_653579 [Kockovaella imperatae]